MMSTRTKLPVWCLLLVSAAIFLVPPEKASAQADGVGGNQSDRSDRDSDRPDSAAEAIQAWNSLKPVQEIAPGIARLGNAIRAMQKSTDPKAQRAAFAGAVSELQSLETLLGKLQGRFANAEARIRRVGATTLIRELRANLADLGRILSAVQGDEESLGEKLELNMGDAETGYSRVDSLASEIAKKVDELGSYCAFCRDWSG